MVQIFACFYFYFISKGWVWFQVFGWSLNLLVVIALPFVPESPKFLISKKRFDEARIALRKIAGVNNYEGSSKVELDEKVGSIVFEGEQSVEGTGDEKVLNGSLSDLIKIRKHLINLVILAFVWMASAFNYFLINFRMKYIEGNIFVNTTTASSSEVCAYILGGIAYQKLGIRVTLISAFAISCIGAISLIIWGASSPDYVPVMILLTRFGVSATFNICYLANAQLFPSIFAGTAIGICNIFAKMSTIIAPLLAEAPDPAPMAVFAAITGVASILSLFIQ